MTLNTPRFHDLFDQLGLDSEDHHIQQFISAHSPLPDSVHLADAPFWSKAQASFLRDALLQDSDWAEQADQLNSALRSVTVP